MIKNALVYRLNPRWSASLDQIEAAAQTVAFVPCGLTQEITMGWVPPREKHGALVESVSGQWILKLMVESKSVPADVLKRLVDERAAEITATTGRKPGKKERKELKEDARLELLPMAFSKRATTTVWISKLDNLLVIDATSQAKADNVITTLVRVLDNFSAVPLMTVASASSAMCNWLHTGEAPTDFSINRDCMLKATDESKAAVRYSRHALDIEEVQQHINHGKVPVMLAMTYDARLSFVLTDSGAIKSIDYLGGIMEGATPGDDRFDTDVAIATGELQKFIPALIDALGGEVEVQPELPLDGDNSTPTKQAKTPDTAATPANDPLYEQAVAIVTKDRKASISLVQRHLQIGYNRAARLIEDMETKGVVSPMNNSGHRTVLAA